ncbi:MAG TPA: trimethylamine methyltransferase family protein, partial [Gaiellaceae bacterium]
MFLNRMPRYEILDPDAVATLERGWRRILTDVGIAFDHPEVLDLLRGAGQRVEGEVAFLDPDFVLDQVRLAPS